MLPDNPVFKADRNQLFAVIAMLSAVFAFSTGEIVIGFALFAIAAVFSLGGLFWNAHTRDKADAAARADSNRPPDTKPGKDSQ
ncbi:MAG: hypothetical protein ABI854_00580 [Betaproteobacteria bacterium]